MVDTGRMMTHSVGDSCPGGHRDDQSMRKDAGDMKVHRTCESCGDLWPCAGVLFPDHPALVREQGLHKEKT